MDTRRRCERDGDASLFACCRAHDAYRSVRASHRDSPQAQSDRGDRLLASRPSSGLRDMVARMPGLIRVDAIWLSSAPQDMRAGIDTLLARVVEVFGAAQPHHAYCFANRNATRMKVLVHDGLGVWIAARRLNRGKFIWASSEMGDQGEIDAEQIQALVRGRSRSRAGGAGAITEW